MPQGLWWGQWRWQGECRRRGRGKRVLSRLASEIFRFWLCSHVKIIVNLHATVEVANPQKKSSNYMRERKKWRKGDWEWKRERESSWSLSASKRMTKLLLSGSNLWVPVVYSFHPIYKWEYIYIIYIHIYGSIYMYMPVFFFTFYTRLICIACRGVENEFAHIWHIILQGCCVACGMRHVASCLRYKLLTSCCDFWRVVQIHECVCVFVAYVLSSQTQQQCHCHCHCNP